MKKMEEYYFYIEDGDDKCVIKLLYDFSWKLSVVEGNEVYGLKYDFDNRNDLDDVIDWLTQNYNYVQEITKEEIGDYIK